MIDQLRLTLFAFIIFSGSGLHAQQRDTLRKVPDTASLATKMDALAKYAEKSSSAELAADKTAIDQARILEQIMHVVQEAKAYFKTVSDTSSMEAMMDQIDHDYQIAIDGILVKQHAVQSFRNLTASANILHELIANTKAKKAVLEAEVRQITLFRYQLDSLYNLRPLFTFNADSASLVRYLKQLKTINRQIHPVDSSLDKISHGVQLSVVEINARLNQLLDATEEMERERILTARLLWDKEVPGISQFFNTGTTFRVAVQEARSKGKLTLLFYIRNNESRLWIGLFLLLALTLYLISLKKASAVDRADTDSTGGHLVLRYPFLSALLTVCSLYQFVFISPPFLFNALIWLVASIALTIIFYKQITKYWLRVWLSVAALFTIASTLNLLLQPSQPELLVTCFIAITGVTIGLSALLKGPRSELREQWILFPIGIMVVMESGALLACITGRYNLCKSLVVVGFLSVLIAILFLWVIRLVNDWLLMASEIYRQQNRKFFYLNPDKIGDRAPFIFYLLLIIGWTLIVGRNFPGFDKVVEPMNDFLVRERTLGEYSFSITNVLLFIAIMATAVIISRIVSFFTSDQLPKAHSPLHKMQSWLLLIRISIICLGLFLAVAATGIPLDRLTIVLGALSVGVGFGLQALVNNLISGLIIAFERPVHVGDHVDIDGQAGVMKSIGFRSSIIYTQDGADMVIPNGDLLNAHLINWSLGGNRKRIKIGFAVPFDTDLGKVKQLINSALEQDKRILHLPSPVVQFDQVRNGMIEVLIYFWPQSLSQGAEAQSNLIELIVSLFKQNGLTIPIPQQEVHLHKEEKTDLSTPGKEQ